MNLRLKFAASIALMPLLAGVTAVALAPSASAAPAVTLSQTEAVAAGQPVTVSGTGFAPNANAFLAQCSDPATGKCDTENFVIAPTDAQGTFSTSFTVRGGDIGGANCPGVDDAPCYLVVTDNPQDPSGASVAPFDMAPYVMVDPASDVEDGQKLQVTGLGFPQDTTAFVTQCADPSKPDTCDAENFAITTTDGDGGLSAELTVRTGTFGSGTCDASSTCFVAATTSPTEPDADQAGVAAFSFASDQPEPAATKTTASYSPKTGTIKGAVRSAGGGVEGLVVKVQRKVKGEWDVVGRATTGARGAYETEVLKKGTYRVVTPAQDDVARSKSGLVVID